MRIHPIVGGGRELLWPDDVVAGRGRESRWGNGYLAELPREVWRAGTVIGPQTGAAVLTEQRTLHCGDNTQDNYYNCVTFTASVTFTSHHWSQH